MRHSFAGATFQPCANNLGQMLHLRPRQPRSRMWTGLSDRGRHPFRAAAADDSSRKLPASRECWRPDDHGGGLVAPAMKRRLNEHGRHHRRGALVPRGRLATLARARSPSVTCPGTQA